MSIKAMTWAFGLPLEPRAKLALLAIADNARDDGIAWPSRDTIAEKSSQSRSTVNRRVKTLVELGIIRLMERFREDGTRTTDEIHLDLSVTPDEVLRKLHDSGTPNEAETDDENASESGDPQGLGGTCQPDTLGVQSGHGTGAVLTGGGSQSGHGQDEPSLEQDSPPTPSGGPLSKADKEAVEKRKVLWHRFLGIYPGISAMDQQATETEFQHLSVDDAEWAVGAAPLFEAECRKLKKPPKNAHIWLRKAMFRNFPKGTLDAPPPEGAWIAENSDEDRALKLVRHLAKVPTPLVRNHPAGGPRGYPYPADVGPDLLAMLTFEHESPLKWPAIETGSAEYAAWHQRIRLWVGGELRPNHGDKFVRLPCQWPPSKEGTIYRNDEDIPRAS